MDGRARTCALRRVEQRERSSAAGRLCRRRSERQIPRVGKARRRSGRAERGQAGAALVPHSSASLRGDCHLVDATITAAFLVEAAKSKKSVWANIRAAEEGRSVNVDGPQAMSPSLFLQGNRRQGGMVGFCSPASGPGRSSSSGARMRRTPETDSRARFLEARTLTAFRGARRGDLPAAKRSPRRSEWRR